MHSNNRIYKYISIFPYICMYIYSVYIHITYLYVNLISFPYHTISHTYLLLTYYHTLVLFHTEFLCTWRRVAQTFIQIFFHFRICFFFFFSPFLFFFFFFSTFDPLHFLYHDNSVLLASPRRKKSDPLVWATVYKKLNEWVSSLCTECFLNFFFFFFCIFLFFFE